MNKIKLLPLNIINEIAAGEVIERPVAVVKELIENSIDANSTRVSVNIVSGGVSKIIVSDNGNGIDKKYIEISVDKHTTSKLKNESLNYIGTLGFRGEALNSISNASEFTIISRSKSFPEAFKLNVAYGKKVSLAPSKGNVGTIVKVENLFKHLPVRKKFLKSENSERLAIKNLIKKFSLTNPKITFIFLEDDKVKFELIGRDHIKGLDKRVFEIYGESFIKSSFYAEKKYPNYQIKIFASIPTYNKSNWNLTTIIINGRIIKDRLLLGVIKAAYAGLLAGNRFPVVILYIDINSNYLDINVHPTKAEVRILNRNIINSSIIKIIRNKIEKMGLRFSIEAEKHLMNKIKKNVQIDLNNNFTSNKEDLFKEGQQKVSKLFDDQQKNQINNYQYQLGHAKAQIHNMFIVAQTKDSLILVDQHAAHERIVLENLKKNYHRRKILRQVLLIPEIIYLDQGKKLVLRNRKAINEFGFEFEDYGENALIVREIPAILGKINVNNLFQDLQEQIHRLGQINPNDSSIEKILSSIACHNSIRAGKKLNIEEMNSILRLMEKTPNSSQCNHGRPTFVELKLKDVESLFGRI
ncbi:MAG: hypothetical protein CMJ06_01400 [Pelagibacterales bacterium]|nr:hypothetical protein [Pelagibacterales bacterium]OUU63320.1 MAG: hypothetical protein CBC22_01370 [Alphaproteobacteria bacterium TMED62]|tara:strand:- start:8745 stop:10490 length:1746 start_codon:yes stop_codon:yes gene_type:complete